MGGRYAAHFPPLSSRIAKCRRFAAPAKAGLAVRVAGASVRLHELGNYEPPQNISTTAGMSDTYI